MKYWEILLVKQRERGKDGLTIPFLIGSQQYFPEIIDYDISSLIHDIATSDTFETCIRHCMATQTLILEIAKERNNVYHVQSVNKRKTNISIGIMSKGDLGDDIEEVIENLIDKFQTPIEAGRFSAEPNVNGRYANWTEFSEQDVHFIKESFSLL